MNHGDAALASGLWTLVFIDSATFIIFAFSFFKPHTKKLATTGPYQFVRHAQYLGFIAIMVGFLLQWPTLITLVMFPILLVTYVRLARREEREVKAELGDVWRAYAAVTPRWIPRIAADRTGPTAGGASGRPERLLA